MLHNQWSLILLQLVSFDISCAQFWWPSSNISSYIFLMFAFIQEIDVHPDKYKHQAPSHYSSSVGPTRKSCSGQRICEPFETSETRQYFQPQPLCSPTQYKISRKYDVPSLQLSQKAADTRKAVQGKYAQPSNTGPLYDTCWLTDTEGFPHVVSQCSVVHCYVLS